MSEVRNIMQVFAEAAKDYDCIAGRALSNCPLLQIEMLNQGLLSLEDFTEEQIERIMDTVFEQEWIPIGYKIAPGYPKATELFSAIVQGKVACVRKNGELYGRIYDMRELDLLANIDYTDYKITRKQ